MPDLAANSVTSGENRFYADPCANNPNETFTPVEPAMGSGNIFSSICYTKSNIANLPPSTCKS
jgi:hypothetical protein